MIGQTISHYRIVEKLGGGGMGVVYKAEDTELGRFVALKFLPDDVAKDPQALERFRREARAASALNHPNICTIYEIGKNGDQAIHGDGVSGRDDAEASDRRPPDGNRDYPVAGDRDCRRAGCRARGWDHPPRHQAGQHLRDQARTREDSGFRPGEGDAAIGEPGSGSQALGQTTVTLEDAHLTSPGRTVGTVAYMSPEQVRAKELDARTDLFSFGAVLYEMATGQLPFHGESSGLIFKAILDSDPPPAFVSTATSRLSWKRSSTRRWKKTATCAIRVHPRSAPI